MKPSEARANVGVLPARRLKPSEARANVGVLPAEARARILAALACGLEAMVAVYAITRTLEALLLPQPNPATVIQSLHAGYFWRAWIAAYSGAFIALVAALLARTAPLARLALRALPWVALLAVVQALFVP